MCNNVERFVDIVFLDLAAASSLPVSDDLQDDFVRIWMDEVKRELLVARVVVRAWPICVLLLLIYAS